MVVFIFILGIFVGSFLNVVARRLHRQETFVTGFSKCLFCGHRLHTRDLVPVLSYIYLRGRCRYCRQPFSVLYPLIELLTGLVFLLIFTTVLPSGDIFALSGYLAIKIALWWVLAAFLIVIFLYDWKYYLILDKVVLPAAVIALAGNLFLGQHLLSLLLGALAGGGFFLAQFLVSRGQWIGWGDINLGVLMGLILGWPQILTALFVSYMLGSAVSLLLIALRIKKWKDKIPFGTFLSLGTIIAMLYGPQLVSWYLALFL
ncbi:MAG: prepilin peptidase [Parcubacteria group bacterium]|nr:MAG: prepilin peptidase [Parcubacteria group bacterium]